MGPGRAGGNSHRKTRPATTGSAGIGIFECKPTITQPILPVHLHAKKVQFVSLVHNTGYAFDLKMFIILLWMIKSEYICHTGTATTLYTDPELLGGIKTFR